jgi:phosphatidylethanolamine-binding protein (PEBP) family uncharacterized protein
MRPDAPPTLEALMNRSSRASLWLATALLAVGSITLASSSCSNTSTGGNTGGAGTSATGAAGTGSAGTTAAGTAGTGAAGTNATGAAGTGAAGTNATGAAGTGAAGTGSAGTGSAGTGAAGTNVDAGASDKPATGDGGAMTLTTTSLKMVDGGLVFPAASSAPMNMSPALMWTGAPAGTLSFALSMKDLTANNTHFVLYDIPPTVTMLPENLPRGAMPATPAGAIWNSAFGGTPGYQGPGGGGINNYEIQIWALKVAKLDIGTMNLNAIYTTLLPMQRLDSAKILARGTRNGL